MGDEKKQSEHINLKVLCQDNSIVQFKIKKHTPLKKLMVAFCQRTNMPKETIRFRFDGAPVNDLDTPETLEMEEGDTIEVYLPQTGGDFPIKIPLIFNNVPGRWGFDNQLSHWRNHLIGT